MLFVWVSSLFKVCRFGLSSGENSGFLGWVCWLWVLVFAAGDNCAADAHDDASGEGDGGKGAGNVTKEEKDADQ